jgi:hypothetical protein
MRTLFSGSRMETMKEKGDSPDFGLLAPILPQDNETIGATGAEGAVGECNHIIHSVRVSPHISKTHRLRGRGA